LFRKKFDRWETSAQTHTPSRQQQTEQTPEGQTQQQNNQIKPLALFSNPFQIVLRKVAEHSVKQEKGMKVKLSNAQTRKNQHTQPHIHTYTTHEYNTNTKIP
jgi:hypothetical protein